MESKVLGSRYELLERVGMGGMAVVYKAMDKMLNRYVAVKILREEFKENEEFIRRFKVESQAAACLSHQNIVQIYDVGEDDGLHYIVMELLEGETLKHYMNSKGGKLSRREAANFSMQICRALEHAHSKHVVHRDIKPQNIVLTESGKIKVADFGIARAANNSTTVNSLSYAVGSAHYLSPEQARGGYTDHRSDIYSLGVVMYEMFTGKLPFDAEESVSVVMQHIHEEPQPPSEINPDIAPGIEAIILRAMKKEQRLRYNSATEILEDLVMVYQNPSVDVSELNASSGQDSDELPKHPAQRQNRNGANRKSKKKPAAGKGLLIAAIAFFAVLIALVGVVIKFLLFPTGSEVEIPTLTGMTYEEAALECERASKGDIEFEVFVERSEHSEKERDTIISQSPEGGLKIKRSREIKVVMSLGPVALKLEDYTGKNYERVREKLESKGLKVIIEEQDNDTYEEGVIFKQLPDEGTQMAKGDEITLYVSRGTENTVVPELLGKTLNEAIVLIERNDLKVGDIKEEFSEKYPKGEIFRQSQEAFKTVPIDTEIDLYVSSGKKVENNGEDGGTSTEDKKPKKNVKLTLSNLPKDRETVTIKLVLDGKPYYEKDFSTSSGSVTLSVETDKTLSLDVYYDGVYITTKEVKY
ncbi:MAG: Stk1 family PASTA domain-containing Ser/Thr kinase [Ruminococcaceae bacterium]|nr:Stk1 family PASTA domain-containing Ser/Thr kinase [Oscillospiraceae bacterium]